MKFWTIPLAMASLTLMAPVMAEEAAMDTGPDMAQVLAERVEANQGRMGISAALLGDGAPEFAAAGVLKAGEAAPVDPDTLFEIGSISKVFSSLLLAQMVLEGKMDLDAPVADYLPEGTSVPAFEGKAITLFDLATHHSGLPAIPADMQDADPANPYAAYSADDLYAFLAGHELAAAPGADFAYSNTGVALLSLAISHAAGVPYAELVQSRILDRLDMADTKLVVPEADLARFASPHDINGDPIPAWDFDVFAAAGGYRSSARDMAKFVAAASGREETPLKEAFTLMLDRTVPAGSPGISIGLGWMISAVPNGDVVWHNGITGGSNAFVGYQQDGKAAVVLANRLTATGIEDLGFHLIDRDLPLREGFGRKVADVDPALYADYAGTYPIVPEFVLTITTRNDRLFVQATNQPQFEVFPEGGDKFFYTVVDAQISFQRDEAGQVSGLVLHQNGQDMPAAKAE